VSPFFVLLEKEEREGAFVRPWDSLSTRHGLELFWVRSFFRYIDPSFKKMKKPRLPTLPTRPTFSIHETCKLPSLT